MKENRGRFPIKGKCPKCGTGFTEAQPYRTCCGEDIRLPGTEPTGHRGRRLFLIAAASLLSAALLTGAILSRVLTGGGAPQAKLPRTPGELRASVSRAEGYLNDDGRRLAEGRARDAPVYSVDADLDSREGSVSAEETVLYTNRSGSVLNEIRFRVYPNSPVVRSGTPGRVEIHDATAGGRRARFELKGSVLSIRLPDELRGGESVLIRFSFTEAIPELDAESLLDGEGSDGYGIFGRSDNVYNLGYWIPAILPFRNGKWEEGEAPAFGDISNFDFAYYNVAFETPGDFSVAATGLLKGESGGSRKTYTFVAGPVRDFAVQASPDYSVSSKKVGATTVSSYYLEESSDTGRRVLEYGSKALKRYCEHFGPYPYTRLNICEAPLTGSAAGMEFTGQVQIASTLYGGGMVPGLKIPDESEEFGGGLDELTRMLGGEVLEETLEFVIAHEVCHQWWGLGVGSDSLKHPWQDESLTNYCSVLYFRWEHGENAARQVLQTQVTLPYSMSSLLGGEDAVVDSPLDAFSSPEQYSAVVYCKGALFFDRLEKKMGREAFMTSLREYYRDRVFANAAPLDLLTAFKANSENPEEVAALHRRWILERHGDEDVAGSMPELGPLDDLLKDLEERSWVDPEQLEDMLKDLLEGGGPEIPPETDPYTVPRETPI